MAEKLDRGELVLSVRIRTNEEKKVHKCKRKQVRLNNIKEDQALNTIKELQSWRLSALVKKTHQKSHLTRSNNQ